MNDIQVAALESARQYVDIVCEELSPCKVYLFGSLSTGKFDENSDIVRV